jgi:hypothetical protein
VHSTRGRAPNRGLSWDTSPSFATVLNPLQPALHNPLQPYNRHPIHQIQLIHARTGQRPGLGRRRLLASGVRLVLARGAGATPACVARVGLLLRVFSTGKGLNPLRFPTCPSPLPPRPQLHDLRSPRAVLQSLQGHCGGRAASAGRLKSIYHPVRTTRAAHPLRITSVGPSQPRALCCRAARCSWTAARRSAAAGRARGGSRSTRPPGSAHGAVSLSLSLSASLSLTNAHTHTFLARHACTDR